MPGRPAELRRDVVFFRQTADIPMFFLFFYNDLQGFFVRCPIYRLFQKTAIPYGITAFCGVLGSLKSDRFSAKTAREENRPVLTGGEQCSDLFAFCSRLFNFVRREEKKRKEKRKIDKEKKKERDGENIKKEKEKDKITA